ncbi:MAG: ABC transporter ATP-binding protein [Ruminococcaceae bacterium]|nr:ABC transporter ATP-binding protein [Oscillospiraceae bacterium]
MKHQKPSPLSASYFTYMKPHMLWLLLGPLVIAAGGVLEIFQTNYMAHIVNTIKEPGGLTDDGVMSVILSDGGKMCLITLAAIVAGILGVILLTNGSMRFGSSLRSGMFRAVQGFSFENIDKFSTASLVTRLTNDITNVQNTVVQTLRMGTFTAAMLLGALINALVISPKLAALTLFSVPVIATIITIIVVKGFPLFEKMQQAIDGLNTRVQESVTNIRVIKSFVREEHEKSRFYTAVDRLCDVSIRASSLMVTVMPLMQLVMNLTTAAALWMGSSMVQSGELEVGNLMAYNTYIMHILMSMMMMSMTIIMYSRARASSRRLKEVLSEQSTITDKEDAVTAPVTRGTVEFKNVSFRYDPHSPDKVLDSVSFTANAGEVVAIVGATGSAKTTLVSLIPRLYDVSEGEVLVDGVDVRDYALKTLRGGIGMVPQKNVLFSGTIRDNLLWGDKTATEEQIRQAARDAQAEDFILSFPDGYDTVIDQGGVNVSGGQKQRLCIARAMIKKPPILILDDSTSAVDSDTESRIRQSFREHLKGTTVFIIAQRVSSVRDADKILVMDAGRLAGIGTHDELMATNEIYREIVESQQKGVQD